VLLVFWIPIAVWLAAAVLSLIVLGFGGYEVTWKARRLRRDLDGLRALNSQLAGLRDELLMVRHRAARLGPPQG
jgi:hypothetical protein